MKFKDVDPIWLVLGIIALLIVLTKIGVHHGYVRL